MKQKTYQHVCPNASLKNANINEKELINQATKKILNIFLTVKWF